MNLLKRFLKLFLLIFMIIIVLLLTINVPIATFHNAHSEASYDTWMSDNLDNDQFIISTAMLGAHDAFTSDMSILSPVDELSAESIQTGAVGLLIKGFSFRQSKTQSSDVTALLNAGVRYFDIRLTYNESTEQWMTSHTYFSTPFIDVLNDINTFLDSHPGEFLILDIQHVNGVDYTDLSTFESIKQLFQSSGVLDYAYEDNIKPLNQITYGDVTEDNTKAGVVILTKYEETDSQFFKYQSSVRSAWANTDNIDSLFTFLQEEADLISSGSALTGNQVSNNTEAINALDGFRVMQGVLTMQLSGEGIVDALLNWSLIDRAKKVNTSLIDNTSFSTYLQQMPIVMLDSVDTNQNDFLDKIMEIIIEFNQ